MFRAVSSYVYNCSGQQIKPASVKRML